MMNYDPTILSTVLSGVDPHCAAAAAAARPTSLRKDLQSVSACWLYGIGDGMLVVWNRRWYCSACAGIRMLRLVIGEG
jgi:hypothetical protein